MFNVACSKCRGALETPTLVDLMYGSQWRSCSICHHSNELTDGDRFNAALEHINELTDQVANLNSRVNALEFRAE